MKIRRWFSHQNGNRILKLFSLLAQQNRLGARGIQQRFFLGHVQPRSQTTRVTGIHQLQTLLKVFNRAVQNTEFGIELAESEVIAGKFRGNDQADIFEIRGGSLIGSLRRFDAAAAPAKQVDLIASDERKGNVCLRNWTSRREVAAGGAIPR